MKNPSIKGEELFRIQARFPVDLYKKIKGAIGEAKEIGDYTYITPSDVVREAIGWWMEESKKGTTQLLPAGGPCARKVYPILLPEILYHFFTEKFPKGARSEIMERVVRTYLAKADAHITPFCEQLQG